MDVSTGAWEAEAVTLAAASGVVEDKASRDPLVHFSFAFNVGIDGALCVLGFFGNILTILVLHKDKVKTSNGVLLQALAVFDSMFLVYVLLYVVLRSIYPYTGDLKDYFDVGPYMVAFVLPFGWTSQTCTIWIVTMMAIDRYYVVSYPFKANRVCTPKNARKAVVVMFLLAVLFNAPRWPRYYFRAFHSPSSNSTFVSHTPFSMKSWDESLYRTVYHISLSMVLLFIIPLGLLILLNARLLALVKQAQRQRQHMTNSTDDKADGSNTNVTVMMIVIIAVFIVCEFPDFIASIIGAGSFEVDPRAYEYYACVKEMLLVFNSSINFYLYCLFYRRFRQTLAKMLGFNTAMSSRYSQSTTTISTVSK